MDPSVLAGLPDFPALEQLGSALWDDGQARGAAVLVGAGFSRNAEPAGRDVRKLPLWADLRGAMAAVLYRSKPDDAPRDPLRLAEEFRALLGQAALNDLIREQVPDDSWRPGRLHADLMALPWADVLTTNYDTLLERASKRHRVVKDAADLASARRPRVVKLHGSIDGHGRLVIAEEDYRAYPTRSAAFVNTARQAFLENELCLLGFSGDDPNFLQWSGWVRDHLGEHARRIYLVGPLALAPAQRRLLESRNVAPVDFAPLTSKLPRDEAEAKACEMFIAYLASRKPKLPMDWEPAAQQGYGFVPLDPAQAKERLSDPTAAKAMLGQLEAAWKADRDACPDWLVMPGEKREALAFGTSFAPRGLVAAAEHLDRPARLCLFLNAAWRASMALKPIPEDLEGPMAGLARSGDERDRASRATLARYLLREARVRRDEERFDDYGALLESLALPGSDDRSEVDAQRLLWARDGLDFETLSKGIAALDGPDPAWRLLRAALHCECGETGLAKSVLETVRTELADRLHRAPRSAWIESRCAWADALAGAIRMSETWTREPGGRTDSGYDAQEELDRLLRGVRSSRLRRLEEPEGYEAGFGPGSYQDHGSTLRFTSGAPGQEADSAFRFADATCMPLKVENVDILGGIARDALDGEPLPTLLWHLRLVRAISSHSSPALDKHFGRIAVACIEPEVAEALSERLLAAARFWRTRASRAGGGSLMGVEKLRMLLEVLSRLVVRAMPERAAEVFALGCEIAADVSLRHPWLFEQIGNVLESSASSIPPKSRGSLALQCLEFPLPEPGPTGPQRWPEPVAHLFSHGIAPSRPANDGRWRACVVTALESAAGSGLARSQAVHRLAYLDAYRALDDRERAEFGRALWSSVDPEKGGLPKDVDLYPHVVAGLPGDGGNNPLQVASRYMYSTTLAKEGLESRLFAIAVAADSEGAVGRMLPSRKQGLALLDSLAALVGGLPDDASPFRAHARRRIIAAAGRAVAGGMLPVMEPGDLDEARLGFVRRLARPDSDGGVFSGLHEVIRLVPGLEEDVVSDLRRAMSRGDLRDIQGAALAIGRWTDLAADGRCVPFPPVLAGAVIAALEARPPCRPATSSMVRPQASEQRLIR